MTLSKIEHAKKVPQGFVLVGVLTPNEKEFISNVYKLVDDAAKLGQATLAKFTNEVKNLTEYKMLRETTMETLSRQPDLLGSLRDTFLEGHMRLILSRCATPELLERIERGEKQEFSLGIKKDTNELYVRI